MQHTLCSHPCIESERLRHSLSGLRQHLLNGHQCLDSWLALSELVPQPQQRKDCLERAAALSPDNLALQQRYLEACLVLEPHNGLIQQRLNEMRVLHLLKGESNTHFTKQREPRHLGTILVEMGAVQQEQIYEVLERQRRGALGASRMLGTLLLNTGYISPKQLARALIMQQQERSRLRVAPQAFGEFLVDKGYITVQILEEALAQQLRYDEQQRRVLLGEILLQLQALPRLQLARALQEYEQQFWNRFDG